MSAITPLGRGRLTDAVYEQLAELIASGRLVPGEKLVIDKLAKEFDVSITPVREALRRLHREGLVTETPYRGMVVSQASREELRELFALRGLLEGYAGAEACRVMTPEDLAVTAYLLERLERTTEEGNVAEFRRLNNEFHASFVQKTPSHVLRDAIADLGRNTERYRQFDSVFDRSYMEASQAEHRELFAHLQAGRAEEFERLHRRHAMTFVDHLIRAQEEQDKDKESRADHER